MIVYDENAMPVFGVSAHKETDLVECAVWDKCGNVEKRFIKKCDIVGVIDCLKSALPDDDSRDCPQCGGEMLPCCDANGEGWICPDIDCDGYTEWDDENVD